jgi:hypothetical protein
MAEATESLDLNPIVDLLGRCRRFARSAQDPEAKSRQRRCTHAESSRLTA